jgi:hypothetical protein
MSPILGVISSSIQAGIPDSDYFSLATANITNNTTSTINFTDIPSTYKHLQIRWVAARLNPDLDGEVDFQFNSDTGNNYQFIRTYATGVSPNTSTVYGDSTGSTRLRIGRLTSNAAGTLMAGGILDILDYASTSKAKSALTVYGNNRLVAANATQYVFVSGGSWNSTAAINSITIKAENGGTNFGSGTRFALYGLK